MDFNIHHINVGHDHIMSNFIFQVAGLYLVLEKKTQHFHRSSTCIYQCNVNQCLHTFVWYYNVSSKFNFQVAWLKNKVTVDTFREKKTRFHRSSPCIYQWILIYLHKFVWYYNVSSKFNFQVAWLKNKVAVATFRERKNTFSSLQPLHLLMDFNISSHICLVL